MTFSDCTLEHAGIVYSRQPTAIGDMIHGLILVVELLDSDEMKGHVEFLVIGTR